MTTITSNDQEFCLFVMQTAGVNPTDIQPKPPLAVCEAMMNLGPKYWLVITNDRRVNKDGDHFTLHLIENATEKEAWAYFDALCPAGAKSFNVRLVAKGEHTEPINN